MTHLSAQERFVVAVQSNFARFSGLLKLNKPSFEDRGLLSIARMEGKKGVVEILFGPPEYHAEVFLSAINNSRRWGLSELYEIESVRHWLEEYIANTENLGAIEADVEWVFRLLVEGLSGCDGFSWIHAK